MPVASSRRALGTTPGEKRRGTRRYGQSPYSTKIPDFRWFDSSIMLHNSKGWNTHVHRNFPGFVGSTNLSRDNMSREIGRSTRAQEARPSGGPPEPRALPSRSYIKCYIYIYSSLSLSIYIYIHMKSIYIYLSQLYLYICIIIYVHT